MGFYEIFLDASLATNHLVWKDSTYIPDEYHSNLTVLNGHIVVLTATPAYPSTSTQSGDDEYIYLLAYEPIADTWVMLEKFECHLC